MLRPSRLISTRSHGWFGDPKKEGTIIVDIADRLAVHRFHQIPCLLFRAARSTIMIVNYSIGIIASDQSKFIQEGIADCRDTCVPQVGSRPAMARAMEGISGKYRLMASKVAVASQRAAQKSCDLTSRRVRVGGGVGGITALPRYRSGRSDMLVSERQSIVIPSARLGRRGFLKGLCGTSALSVLGGCGTLGGEPSLPPAGTVGKAAFLAPLSGPQSAVGQMMRAAASLGGNDIGPGAEVAVYDSGGTEEEAVTAARAAVAGGARMLLGPLLSGQSRAVAAAVGRVPVVALTNDSRVAGGNLFVFGITPLQSARAVIGFAATRGKRRIGVVVPSTEFGQLQSQRPRRRGFGRGNRSGTGRDGYVRRSDFTAWP